MVTLAWLIVLAFDLCAAVQVFRIAAERWGCLGSRVKPSPTWTQKR
jgi:hypothetical protein